MTFKKLSEIFKKYNIPEDAVIQSDSGWECGETDCDGVFYNERENIVMLTQRYTKPYVYYCSDYYDSDKGKSKGWINISEMNNNHLNIKPPLKPDGTIPHLPDPPESEIYYEGFFTPFKRVSKDYVPLHRLIINKITKRMRGIN